VAGEPILFSVLRHISDAGIEQVGIIVGDTGPEIREAVGDGSAWGLAVTYIPQASPSGLADCVRIARGFLGDDDFLMYLGDNMLRDGVSGLVRGYLSEPVAAQILTVRVPEPQRFGVVELADGRVVRVIEKPKDPPSDLALAGVYLFSPAIHEVIEGLQPSARGEYEITDAIQGLIDSGLEVRAHEVEGWWKDTGQPEDLLEANRLVLSALVSKIEGSVEGAEITGAVQVAAGAQVKGGRLIGPCVIGPGTICEEATIGPDVALGSSCRVSGATVEDSIVMDGCEISDASLTRSLLGRSVVVRGVGRAHLVVGDHGQVTLP
jgi:glucose-1-phosphate thymidylyltransferase